MDVSVRKQFKVFMLRWCLNSLGLWVSVRLLGMGAEDIGLATTVWVFLLAGLIFSTVNSVLKPIVVIMALPAILLTLGLFTLVVNGLMVYLSLKIAPGVSMTFGNSILAGMILGLVNYIVSSVLDLRSKDGTN